MSPSTSSDALPTAIWLPRAEAEPLRRRFYTVCEPGSTIGKVRRRLTRTSTRASCRNWYLSDIRDRLPKNGCLLEGATSGARRRCDRKRQLIWLLVATRGRADDNVAINRWLEAVTHRVHLERPSVVIRQFPNDE